MKLEDLRGKVDQVDAGIVVFVRVLVVGTLVSRDRFLVVFGRCLRVVLVERIVAAVFPKSTVTAQGFEMSSAGVTSIELQQNPFCVQHVFAIARQIQ